MINQKKTAAILLGLTMGLSGSVMAAPAADTADQDLAARIAAIEAQQQELTKQLSALKKENAKLKRTSKVAESNKNAIKGLKEVQNRFQLHGFGRVTWDNDNIKGYIDKHDNRRFYLDLKGKFKVNDNWNFNFESETNPRYASHVMADGSVKYHTGRDDEDGVIQRIWAEGKVGAVNFDVGRRWRGLGFQNVLLGNETDGVVVSTPVNKKGLKASAFYLTPTDKGFNLSLAGVGLQGEVARGLQVSLAVARTNIGRNDRMGINYYGGTSRATISNATINAGYAGANNVYMKISGTGLSNGISATFSCSSTTISATTNCGTDGKCGDVSIQVPSTAGDYSCTLQTPSGTTPNEHRPDPADL